MLKSTKSSLSKKKKVPSLKVLATSATHLGKVKKVKKSKKTRVERALREVSPALEVSKTFLPIVAATAQSTSPEPPRHKKRRLSSTPLLDTAAVATTEAAAKISSSPAVRKKCLKRTRTRRENNTRNMDNVSSETISTDGFSVVCSKKVDVEDPVPISAKLSSAEYRKAHEIVVDAQCPEPLQSFDEVEEELGPALTASLRAQGFASPTPIQAQAWPIALNGYDVVAVAKTGSGKTCGYLLPALVCIGAKGATALQPGTRKIARPSVLVVAPTRELVIQIFDETQKYAKAVSARAVAIYGGVAKGEQIRQLQAGTDLIVCTPGRLHDFMTGDPTRDLPPSITLDAVTYLVLDEADRMLDMGFEDEIRRICEKCPKSGHAQDVLAGVARQTLFFTATWPKEVHKAAAAFTHADAKQVRIGQGVSGKRLTANESVIQKVLVMQDKDKTEQLQRVIREELHPGETAIVFAMRKRTCHYVVEQLSWSSPGVPAACGWCKEIHGDKEQWEREEALGEFRRFTERGGDTTAVLVATDVASRGLDIPGVALVVIYDFSDPTHGPDEGVESYVHKIGRTGRAGLQGRAVTFYTAADSGAHRLAALLRDAKQVIPPALAELAALAKERSASKKQLKGQAWLQKMASKGKGGKGKGKGGVNGKGKGTHTNKGKGKARGKGDSVRWTQDMYDI